MGYYYPPQLGENRIPETVSKKKIKVGACQMLTSEDVQASALKVMEKIQEAGKQEIEILSFPEGTLFGYCCKADYWESAQLEWFQDAEARISAVCKENNIATIVGSAHVEHAAGLFKVEHAAGLSKMDGFHTLCVRTTFRLAKTCSIHIAIPNCSYRNLGNEL